jgi:hypothetical protein
LKLQGGVDSCWSRKRREAQREEPNTPSVPKQIAQNSIKNSTILSLTKYIKENIITRIWNKYMMEIYLLVDLPRYRPSPRFTHEAITFYNSCKSRNNMSSGGPTQKCLTRQKIPSGSTDINFRIKFVLNLETTSGSNPQLSITEINNLCLSMPVKLNLGYDMWTTVASKSRGESQPRSSLFLMR